MFRRNLSALFIFQDFPLMGYDVRKVFEGYLGRRTWLESLQDTLLGSYSMATGLHSIAP